MEKAKIVLLIFVAVLLIVLIIDRSRVPEQMGELQKSIDQLNASIKTLNRSGISASGAGQTQAVKLPLAEVDKNRDGIPKLGVNFLEPYNDTIFKPEHRGGILRYHEIPPPTLNRLVDNNLSSLMAFEFISDSLVSTDPVHPDRYMANVATSVVITDDYKKFTITIRDGIMWQRPLMAKRKGFEWMDKEVPLTAGDFAFYLEMIKHPDMQCPHLKGYFESLQSFVAKDDHTLELVWSKKEYTNIAFSIELIPFPRHIYTSYEDGSPIPAEQVPVLMNKHWFDVAKQSVGIGAFILSSFEPAKSLKLIRNPDYWGAPLHFDGIEWDGVTVQADAKLVAFKNGQVHYLDTITPNQYKADILDGKEPRFDGQNGRNGPLGWERVSGLNGYGTYRYMVWNQRRAL
jgi:ABC-type transport system substrate-binding protein